MYALMNMDYTGISYKNDIARKECFDRLYKGKPITVYLDLLQQSNNDKYFLYQKVQDKVVIENSNYKILYSRVILYISYTEDYGLYTIKASNLSNREKREVEFLLNKLNKVKKLEKLKKVSIYPHIFINGEYGQFLIILDKSPFNALMCDCRAFLRDERTFAENITDIFNPKYIFL